MKKFPLMHPKIVTTQLSFYAVNLLSPVFEANQPLSIKTLALADYTTSNINHLCNSKPKARRSTSSRHPMGEIRR